jgi:predicted histone-like DNA-binding protein
MSDGGTLRRTDVLAVIDGLLSAILRELREGNDVQLGALGSFYLSAHSEGALSAEEVNPSLIKKANLRYRPSAEVREMLQTLRYQKLSSADDNEDAAASSGS